MRLHVDWTADAGGRELRAERKCDGREAACGGATLGRAASAAALSVDQMTETDRVELIRNSNQSVCAESVATVYRF